MIFSIVCILFATVNAADQHETEQFKVIPGGEEHTHTGSMVSTLFSTISVDSNFK